MKSFVFTPLKSTRRADKHSLRAFSHVALLVMLAAILAACGSTATPIPKVVPPTEVPTAATTVTQPTVTNTAAPTLIKLKVGVSPVPHGDILKYIKDNLATQAGLDLTIVEFTDYVQPNLALGDGQIDANYFQHVPYQNDFAKEHNLDLVAAAAVHIEPLGIYSKKITSLKDLADKAIVAIPNDATNGGRALRLLADNGLIKLKEDAALTASVQDIAENPKNLQIKELEAAQLARTLDDVTVAVINGNYALQAGLTPSQDALALESGENNPYANVLTVVKGHENDEGIQSLVKLLTSPEVKKFIEDKYQGSVIPAFQQIIP